MNRTVVAATVLGALLVGGAGTGVTHARWLDQTTQPASSARSGAMAFTAGSSATSLTVARGTTDTTTVLTVTDGSQGKNLQQRVAPTVSGTNGVTASLLTRSGGSCTTTAQAPVVLTPSQAFTSCLSVSVPAGSTATSATVTITLNGAQVRGAAVAGWTYGPQILSVQVAIQGTAPVAPSVTCGTSNNNSQVINWGPVSGATSYEVFRSAVADSGFTSQATIASGTTYTYTPTGNETSYLRVKAVSVNGSSAFSNAVRVIRNGSTVTCGVVTP